MIVTCHNILRHVAFGFTSSPNEGVLLIFIAPYKSIASAGFEPANLWSHADTLTITPLRRQKVCLLLPHLLV
jgi:hypothetical protein